MTGAVRRDGRHARGVWSAIPYVRRQSLGPLGAGAVEQRHHVVKTLYGVAGKIFRLDRTNLSERKDKVFERQQPLRTHKPQPQF
jgi:hypothetical protein